MIMNKKSLGKRIKLIRLSLGDNMREFGERIADCLGQEKIDAPSDSIVSRWEKGVSKPSPDRIKAIAKLGDISVDELLYGTTKELIGQAKMYYNELLNNSEEKHLFEVPSEVKDSLLLEAIKNFENSIFIGDDHHLRRTIYWRFKKYYFESVKSNESLLNLYVERLITLEEELNNFFAQSVLCNVDDELMIFIEIYSESISEDLYYTLKNNVIKIREEAYVLEKEFTNKSPKNKPNIQFIGPALGDRELNRKIIEDRYKNDDNYDLIRKDILKALEKFIQENDLNITGEELFKEHSKEFESFMKAKTEYLDLQK